MKIIIFLYILCLVSASVFANEPSSLKGVAEKTEFKIFKNETELGIISYEIDDLGNYKRIFNLQFANQIITYKFTLNVNNDGLWESIIIDVPGQKTDITRKNDLAEFIKEGKPSNVALSDGHIIYDSYGPIFESFLLQKYDRKLEGKQKISCFFVPSHCSDVIVEYAGEQIKKVNGENLQLYQFNVDASGITRSVFVDIVYNVYMISIPAQSACYVRSGYEDLLKLPCDSILKDCSIPKNNCHETTHKKNDEL